MTHANQTRSQVLEAPWDSAVSSGPGWRDASLPVPNLTWRGAWLVCATTCFFDSANFFLFRTTHFSSQLHGCILHCFASKPPEYRCIVAACGLNFKPS